MTLPEGGRAQRPACERTCLSEHLLEIAIAGLRKASILLAERHAVRRLQALDDAALKDICLSRGGIEGVVRDRRGKVGQE